MSSGLDTRTAPELTLFRKIEEENRLFDDGTGQCLLRVKLSKAVFFRERRKKAGLTMVVCRFSDRSHRCAAEDLASTNYFNDKRRNGDVRAAALSQLL
uniref:Uncharacterized protein n=1 Tax=Panagrellus redivivus TaxID=6233 RepID=A0A7E4VDG0_PANRE